MKKMLCFDMDGTIADLYGVNGWLYDLRHEIPTPYEIAEPLWDMNKLRAVLLELSACGWEVRIISWLSKDSSEEYKNKVRTAKKKWLDRYNFPYEKLHFVAYGTTKADSVRRYAETAILFDDNEKVRKGWHLGETINPTTTNILEFLASLLD